MTRISADKIKHCLLKIIIFCNPTFFKLKNSIRVPPMRVISGTLKGITIPFDNDKYDNANATPQKVKEALFSILGDDLIGKSFLDLYACSGQIGIEALSRGAELVVFNEIDIRRYHFIKSQIEKRNLTENTLFFRYHAFRCLRYLFYHRECFF